MGILAKIFGVDTNTRRTVTDAKRRSGFEVEGVDRRDLNEILFKLKLDHIIGSAALVASNDATIYWNSANTEFRDQDEDAVTLVDGDRILWVGLDAITADIDISTIDDLVHSTDTGVTIAFGSQNILLGSNQSGFLNCSGTGDLSATDSPEFVVNNNRTEKLTDFKTSKDLVLNVATSTTATLKASTIRLLDINNNGLLIKDVDETFNSATDLNAGTLYVSTWYQKWLAFDYLGNIERKLVPDLESVADANVLNSLSDSTATFQTDAVQVGDEIFQTTDQTKGFVKAVSSETVITCKDEDGNDLDLFPLGTEDYKIRILSPQFDSGKVFKGRIGAAFRNSSGNFDDSTYTQIQEPKDYSEAAGDFAITGTDWSTNYSLITAKQSNDWTGKGTWRTYIWAAGGVPSLSRSSFPITFSGISFVASISQPFSGWSNGTVDMGRCNTTVSTGTLTINHTNAAGTAYAYQASVITGVKPSFVN